MRKQAARRGVRRPWAVLFAVLLLTPILAGCLGGGRLVGQPPPAFEFVTNEGTRVNETTYLGKFVILDLMATWCAPCRLEVAHLREIQRLHGDQVVIISIGADPTETMAQLDAFGEELGATWPYALDRDGRIGRAMEMRIIPKLVILDPEGVVVFEREGEVLPAAISRVIDPGAVVGNAGVPVGSFLAGLALGFVAWFNPYRRFHRDGARRAPSWLALAALALLGALAWRYAGLVSTRATYSSLALGLLSVGLVAWWWRARRGADAEPDDKWLLQAGDRMYETVPHFALVLVLGLQATGSAGFFAPLVGFLLGAAAAIATREQVPRAAGVAVGLGGLALAGVGLLLFGSRAFLGS